MGPFIPGEHLVSTQPALCVAKAAGVKVPVPLSQKALHERRGHSLSPWLCNRLAAIARSLAVVLA